MESGNKRDAFRRLGYILAAFSILIATVGAAKATQAPAPLRQGPPPRFSQPAAFDVSPALAAMANSRRAE